jgi:AcrR family transcriptional regulator
MTPAAKRSYHHGNLREALVEAGVQLAREGGPDAVVLREASRRAGVSHNAAYRHFADRDELLRAVCAKCMEAIAKLMELRIAEAAAAGKPAHGGDAVHAGLRATGLAYLEFAQSEPGWFRTAFAVPAGLDYLDDDEGVGDAGLGPLGLLALQLDALVDAGALPRERREHAELAAWSGVHGLSMLLLDGPLRALTPAEREAAIARVLDTIERGL